VSIWLRLCASESTFLVGLELAEKPECLPPFLLVEDQEVDDVGPVVASLVAGGIRSEEVASRSAW
jgi:hypothetical protein